MLTYQYHAQDNIIEIMADGKITREDMAGIYDRIDGDMARHGSVKLLERIGPLEGIELGAIWDDLKLGMPRMGKISHAAVVADQAWIKAGTGIARHLLPVEVRQFPADGRDEAWDWLVAA